MRLGYKWFGGSLRTMKVYIPHDNTHARIRMADSGIHEL